MITFLFPSDKTLSQETYYYFINLINLFAVECTCHKKGCLIFYGWYERKVKTPAGLLSLAIQRVMCKECGRTHALMPSVLVPCSWVSLKNQQDILILAEDGALVSDVMEQNPRIDENNIKYIIRQYKKHWKQRILSIGLTLRDSLSLPCFSVYSRQFMQIRRTPNILFSPPTATDLTQEISYNSFFPKIFPDPQKPSRILSQKCSQKSFAPENSFSSPNPHFRESKDVKKH